MAYTSSSSDWPSPERHVPIHKQRKEKNKAATYSTTSTPKKQKHEPKRNSSSSLHMNESPRRSLRAGTDTTNQKIKNMSAYLSSRTPGEWDGSKKFTKLNVRHCNDNNFDKVGKIYIATSTILNAGQGLFADTEFLPGDVIVEYSGILYHSSDTSYINPTKDNSYIVENNAGWSLDALPLLKQKLPMQYVGGMINSCTKDQVSEKQNCYWYLFDHKCGKYSSINQIHQNSVSTKFKSPESRKAVKERRYFVATKKIKKGDELFTYYGDEYWKEHLGNAFQAP